jgi:hypothetical protein
MTSRYDALRRVEMGSSIRRVVRTAVGRVRPHIAPRDNACGIPRALAPCGPLSRAVTLSMSNEGGKIPWHGVLISIQPRIRLSRSFDHPPISAAWSRTPGPYAMANRTHTREFRSILREVQKTDGLDGGARWIRTAGLGCSIGSGQFLPVSVLCQRRSARLK